MVEWIIIIISIAFYCVSILSILRLKVKTTTSILLILFNFTILFWLLSVFGIWLFNQFYFSIWFARASFFFTSFALVFFTLFIKIFKNHKIGIVNYIITVLGSIISVSCFSNIIISDILLNKGVEYPPVVFGKGLYVFLAFVLSGMIYLLIEIFTVKSTNVGIKYLRFKYITFSIIIAAIFGISTNVLIPIFWNDLSGVWLGPIAFSLIAGVTTYAVVEERLFSLYYWFYRVSVFTVSVFIFLVLFFVIAWIIKLISIENWFIFNVSFGLFYVILFVLLYPIINIRVSKIFARLFSQAKVDSSRTLDQLVKEISIELKIRKISTILFSHIKRIFSVERMGIVLFDKYNTKVLYEKYVMIDEDKIDLRDMLQVVFYWDSLGHSTILVREEVETQPKIDRRLSRIVRFMKKNQIEIILPLNRKVQLNGVILLGQRVQTDVGYVKEDLGYWKI